MSTGSYILDSGDVGYPGGRVEGCASLAETLPRRLEGASTVPQKTIISGPRMRSSSVPPTASHAGDSDDYKVDSPLLALFTLRSPLFIFRVVY